MISDRYGFYGSLFISMKVFFRNKNVIFLLRLFIYLFYIYIMYYLHVYTIFIIKIRNKNLIFIPFYCIMVFANLRLNTQMVDHVYGSHCVAILHKQ